MHFLSAIPGGDTLFLGLNEFLQESDEEIRQRLRRMWFVSGVGEDLMSGKGQMSLLPLVYPHPFTGDETMCFHLGKGYCLGWIEERPPAQGIEAFFKGFSGDDEDDGGPQSVLRRLLRSRKGGGEPTGFIMLPPEPTQEFISDSIDQLSDAEKARLTWQQEWKTGDFALIDNLALAHLPVPGTQAPSSVDGGAGLRLFHRTTMVDPEAVVRNTRGAASVLLTGVGGSRIDSAAGALEDPAAMREVLKGLTIASQLAAPTSEKPVVKQPAKEARTRKEAAQRLRNKANARRAKAKPVSASQ